MMQTRIRRAAAATAAAATALALLSGCASITVAEANKEKSSTAKKVDYQSIVPKGDVLEGSKKIVQENLDSTSGFTPPKSGPKAQKAGTTIAFVGGDLSNGGINAVDAGVKEAAGVIGWKVNSYDGKGTVQGRTDALNQAIASGSAAIVVGGFDPTEQAANISRATKAGIPVIGWNAGAAPGPGNGMFTNVSTNPLDVAKVAAAYTVASSHGKAGVAIFTDGQYQIAIEKAKAMETYIKACSGCSVLSYQDSPIADASSRMPGIISELLQKNGDKLTYLMAINGNYFGGAQQALRAAGKAGDGPPYAVAAGDGDSAEFQRIRNGDYQAATVASPLTEQGWQVVDEINRALAKQKPSGFVMQPALVTKENVPSGDVYDPKVDYRSDYRKIWGK